MPIIPDGGGFLLPDIKKKSSSYGLLTTIEPSYPSDDHWMGGVEWEADCVNLASATLLSCDPVAPLDTDGGLLFCTAEPFTVYGSYKCSTGGRLISESMTVAASRLERNKERAVENIFWTGITPVGVISPSLQGGNSSCGIVPIDLTPTSGSLSPVAALAALESNIAECGEGVLHANYGLLPYLFANRLAIERDSKIYTPSGQLIVAGAGYPSSGPGNAAAIAGETWAFMSGGISVYASGTFYTPPNVNEGVDRSRNDVTFIAEQSYSVIFDGCCLFAVRVELC